MRQERGHNGSDIDNIQVRQQQLRVVTPALAGKILKIAYKMEFRFLGLDHRVHIQILLWRVFAHLIHLVSALANADNQDNKDEATRQINTFIKRLRHVQRYAYKQQVRKRINTLTIN